LNKTIIAYGLIGSVSALLDFLFFSLLVKVFGEANYLAAHIAGYLLGTSISFYLNKKYNFSVTDNIGRRFYHFFLVGLIGLATSMFLIHALVSFYSFAESDSKLAVIIIVVPLQYLVNKRLTFKSRD
jgi:putative flippase GtrA